MSKRFSRNRFRTHWWLLLIAILFAARLAFDYHQASPPDYVAPGRHQVSRVVDGDTLLLASGVRLRLQGIDTPETVKPNHPVEPWGFEASEFTQQFVSDAGGEVEITFGAERLDKFGRHLGFVWHGEKMLNEQLILAGLARARLNYRYSGTMKRRFARAEDEARAAGRGIWSAAISSSHSDE